MAIPEQTPAYALFVVDVDEYGTALLPPLEELQYTDDSGNLQGGFAAKSAVVDGTVIMFVHTSQSKMDEMKNAEDATYVHWEDIVPGDE